MELLIIIIIIIMVIHFVLMFCSREQLAFHQLLRQKFKKMQDANYTGGTWSLPISQALLGLSDLSVLSAE